MSLIAIARSLKKKKQQLQADQDLLTDRWTEVLAAEEYGLERQTADRPPRGRDKTGYQPEYQPTPPRRYTIAQGNMHDLQDILENKAGQPRSIYGSRGAPQRAMMTVASDTSLTNPAGPNIATQTNPTCVAT